MNQIKFSDWQEFSLKKDVEKIAKEVKKEKKAMYCIIWEAIVFFFTFSLDHIFDLNPNDERANNLYFLAFILAASPLLVAITITSFKFAGKLISARKGLVHIVDYVDNFDNKICYWIMISRSYKEMIDNALDVSEAVFYYQEASYYANKAIFELFKMSPIIPKVFSNEVLKVKRNKVISVSRLINVVQLIVDSKPSAKICENNNIMVNNKIYNGKIGHKEIVHFQIDIDKEYSGDLIVFLNRVKNSFPDTSSVVKELLDALE